MPDAAAPLLDVRVPRTYAAEVDESGGEFVLLFEDLGPCRQGNQLDSCSLADARHAIRPRHRLVHVEAYATPLARIESDHLPLLAHIDG